MAAGVFPFEVDCFAEFLVELTWTDSANVPIDLTGYEAQMDIACAFGAPPLYTMATNDLNDSITFPDPTLGQIQLFIPSSVTGSDVFANLGKGVYTLMLLPPEQQDPIRLLQGTILGSRGIQGFQPQ